MVLKFVISQSLTTTIIVIMMLTTHISAILNAAGVTCGRAMIRKGRIKGGHKATEGEFPWLVSIRIGTDIDSNHICGGSLVHSRFVLTAAHCMQNKVLRFVNVMAGEYDIKGHSSHEQIRGVKKVYMHDNFVKGYINDIALLELNEPIKWTRFVRPICLPDTDVDDGANSIDKDMMTVAGWGYTDENSNGGTKSRFLKKVNVPIVDLKTCQKWFDSEVKKSPGDPESLSLYGKNHICAGYVNGEQDSCQGDSGGPLMKIDASGREVIVGVVSSGIGCGRPKVPGIYTRIVSYIPWIRSILTSNGITNF